MVWVIPPSPTYEMDSGICDYRSDIINSCKLRAYTGDAKMRTPATDKRDNPQMKEKHFTNTLTHQPTHCPTYTAFYGVLNDIG